MSRNIHSSDGIAEDMIRSFVQFSCAELHAKTLFEKITSELEEGIVEPKVGIEKASNYEKMVESYATLRRKTMIALYEMFDGGDKSMWCLVKHLGMAMYTAFESYQASNGNDSLLEIYLESNKEFVKALSLFLGVELIDCAACFSDFLKAKEDTAKESE